MQDHPGAPGTARKGITRTVVPAACGGAAAPMAPGPDHPLATTARLPGQGRPSAVPPAPDHNRSRARHKMAPGHGRPLTAQRAARHDRPRATPRAPGADVPPATTAGAPGQHRLSAVPSVPDHDRSCARHKKAPGHDRPSVAPSGAAGHDRPCATPQAPGHDVPLAATVRAPGYGRPCAAQLVPDHHWSHHAPMAPPGHALARAGTSVPIATAPLPARVSRLLQERLSRITATPDNRTYLALPPKRREPPRPAIPSVSTVIPAQAGIHVPPWLRGDHRGATHRQPAPRTPKHPPTRYSHSTTHPVHPLITAPTAARRSPPTAASVHPATQAPTRPSPTTAGTGVSHQTHLRAPPPRHCGAGRNPRPPAQRRDHRLTRVGFCVGAQHVAPNRPSFPRARESKREPPTL